MTDRFEYTVEGLAWAAVRRWSRDKRLVRLVSQREPTSERWRAFGWSVTRLRAGTPGS